MGLFQTCFLRHKCSYNLLCVILAVCDCDVNASRLQCKSESIIVSMIIILAISLLVTQICSSSTSFVFCLNLSVPDGSTLDRELRQHHLDSGVSGKSTCVLIEASWKTSAKEHVITLYVHQHGVAKNIKEL